MIRHCDRCDTKEERIAELEDEWDKMRKERNSAVSECSDLMNVLRKVKEELEDELKEAKNNYERYRHLSKRYQKRCGEKSRELWDTRGELKKVKKEWINPDDIDWDEVAEILWGGGEIFKKAVELKAYLKTKAGGE